MTENDSFCDQDLKKVSLKATPIENVWVTKEKLRGCETLMRGRAYIKYLYSSLSLSC